MKRLKYSKETLKTASFLGVHPVTVYRYKKRGILQEKIEQKENPQKTIKGIASFLGVCKETVINWKNRGILEDRIKLKTEHPELCVKGIHRTGVKKFHGKTITEWAKELNVSRQMIWMQIKKGTLDRYIEKKRSGKLNDSS